FERGLGEAEFFEAFKIDARCAAQGAAAFDVKRERVDLVSVVAKRGEAGARVVAEHATEAAVLALAEAGDAGCGRDAESGDAQTPRTANVTCESDRDGGAQTRVLRTR